MRILIALLSLLWAVPAWADWSRGSVDIGSLTSSYEFSDTTDPSVLGVGRCSSVTVNFNPDEDGTNTGATAQLYDCQETTLSTTNHCHLIRVVDVDGVVQSTMDGSSGRRTWNVVVGGRGGLGVDVTANPGSDDARIDARCNP